MGIGLWLELGSGVRVRVRVMARHWVEVKVRILFCSSTAQFLTIFTHSALRGCRMAMVLRIRLDLGLGVSLRV